MPRRVIFGASVLVSFKTLPEQDHSRKGCGGLARHDQRAKDALNQMRNRVVLG